MISKALFHTFKRSANLPSLHRGFFFMTAKNYKKFHGQPVSNLVHNYGEYLEDQDSATENIALLYFIKNQMKYVSDPSIEELIPAYMDLSFRAYP